MIGLSVSELIGEACVAMEFAADSRHRVDTPSHPTRSEALCQAAVGVDCWITQGSSLPEI